MSKKVLKSSCVLVMIALTAGCASKNFYTDAYTWQIDEKLLENRAYPPAETPKVDHVNYDQLQDGLNGWVAKNYGLVGMSSFKTGAFVPESQAIELAKSLKVDLVVIMNPQEAGSYATSAAVVRPTVSSSSSSIVLTDAARRNPSKVVGTGTSTTYSTTTDYVPVTEHLANFAAFYFARNGVPVLGVGVRNLTDEEKRQRQSNYGVVAVIVVEKSPAYAADFLKGDIIEKFNGEKITSEADYSEKLEALRGKKVEIAFSREGQKSIKTVHFN